MKKREVPNSAECTFRRFLPPAWGGLLVFLAGCGGREAPDTDPFTTYDSAGVEMVVSREPLWSLEPGWSVDLSPELVLGPDLGPDRFFFQVRDVVRFGDGRLVVENRGSQELFVFDSTGVFLAAWGGRGEGPGEFSRMRLLERCGGQQLAALEDWRVTFLDSVGSFQGTARLPQSVAGYMKEARGVGEDCQSVFLTELVPGYDPTGIGTACYPVRGLWVSLGAPRVDTLGPFRGPESVAGRGGRPEFLLPFACTANWASDGNAIYYGWGDRPEIRIYSAEGSLLRVLRWQPPPDSITEADWAAWDADVEKERETSPRTAAQYLPREDYPRPESEAVFRSAGRIRIGVPDQ